MRVFYLLGFIILGFASFIILFPEYHSITEISDDATFLKINSCDQMHSLDNDLKKIFKFY